MSFFDNTFWQSFVSDLGATIIGVVLGIPVALLISRWIEALTEKERRKKILTLLKEELVKNREILQLWHYPSDDPASESFDVMDLSVFLGDEVWRAFSEGGELQWIKDPSLLKSIAFTYFQLETIKKQSERYFLLATNRGVSEKVRDIRLLAKQHADLKRISDRINSGIREIAIDSLEKTLVEIQNRLK